MARILHYAASRDYTVVVESVAKSREKSHVKFVDSATGMRVFGELNFLVYF